MRRVISLLEGASAASCAGAAVGCLGAGKQHVLRQPKHHGARAAGARRLEGARHELRDALGFAHDADPIGHRAEHGLQVDFLEGAASLVGALDQPDEEDHGRCVVVGDIHPAGGVGGAGRTRHERDPGLSRQLARGLGHHRRAAFVAADDGADGGGVEERVERRDEALARHGE